MLLPLLAAARTCSVEFPQLSCTATIHCLRYTTRSPPTLAGMVQLTDIIIKGKTRCDRLDDVRNLNLWGQDITDVSILQRTPNMEVLSLSVNGISSLRHFMHCKFLKELYLRKNNVTDITDIRFLMPLSHLRVLWLSDNPCAETPNYRSFVLAHLPAIEKLDNVDVTSEDRKAAQNLPLLHPATELELQEEHEDPAPAAKPSSRPLSPVGPVPLNPATAGQQGFVSPSSLQPASNRSRVPGASAAVQGEPHSSCAASKQLQPAVAAGSRDGGYDATFSMLSQGAAAGPSSRSPAGTAEESFAFARQQYDPYRYSSQAGAEQQEQYQLPSLLQRPSAAGPGNNNSSSASHVGASPNVLYAVMALLADLDLAGLSIVQKEVDQRLRGQRG